MRQSELREITSVINEEDCRAVFLTSGSGLGASTILHELAAEAKAHVPVISIHGTMSLAKVPFGVLAPFWAAADKANLSVGMSVLHSLLAEVERLRDGLPAPGQSTSKPPLIIIDDAHSLDTATAELLVNLVMSGTVNIVASHLRQKQLPEPLPKLWSTGIAENIMLRPLTLDQGHYFCESTLGGPVLRATSWHFWSVATGNPLLLRMLLVEAVKNGQLSRKHGRWVSAPHSSGHGRVLSEVISTQLRGLSDEGQAALNLVALSEPVTGSIVRELAGESAVDELEAWSLVRQTQTESGLLSLANPIYGTIIREMIPIRQSRLLHEQLVTRLGDETLGKEALLRRVVWAHDIGVEVPDGQILSAAIFAGKLFQSATSLELVQSVRGNQYRLRANMVKARAKYNLGDYQGAFSYMESMPGEAQNLTELLFGSLLRSSTRAALAMPVCAVEEDIEALRNGGERLAMMHPDEAESIRTASKTSALLLKLMALSREGKYSEMAQLTEKLTPDSGLVTPLEKLYRAVALAMDSERLTAQGFPLQALVRAQEAFAIEHSEDDDVFFLPETILLRHLAAALCAGSWEAAAEVLEHFSVEVGPVVFSFGSGANVVRGMALLRCGNNADALEILLMGLDALKISDPQQLLGCCTAMASYAAARMDRRELAHQLAAEHLESNGMFVVVAHERAYMAAARHILAPDGGGVAELLAQADAARVDNSSMLELNALVLALEMGDGTVAARTAKVAAVVEGPWARSVGQYASAVDLADGQALAEASEVLAGAGLLGLAHQALARSEALHGVQDAPDRVNVRSDLRKVSPVLGVQTAVGGTLEETPPLPKLTRRELEVTTLAASGMTDREIADSLGVALRTVEGHLYRSYSKLGVSARENLDKVFVQMAEN